MARCDAEDGRHRDAIAKLDEAVGLLTPDNTEDRAAYDAQRAASRARLARLVVTARPGTSPRVLIDGVDVQPRATAHELDPGRRSVVVDGRTATLELVSGDNPALVVPLDEASGPQRAPAAGEASSSSSPWLAPAIVSFGIGGLAMAGAAVTGAMALSNDADAEQLCGSGDVAACDAAIDDTEALFAPNLALFVVGGVALAAGTTFLVLELGHDKADPDDAGANLELRLGLRGASAAGTF